MASIWKSLLRTQRRRNWSLHGKIVATFGAVATLGRLIDVHQKNALFDSADIENFIMLETNPNMLKKEISAVSQNMNAPIPRNTYAQVSIF